MKDVSVLFCLAECLWLASGLATVSSRRQKKISSKNIFFFLFGAGIKLYLFMNPENSKFVLPPFFFLDCIQVVLIQLCVSCIRDQVLEKKRIMAHHNGFHFYYFLAQAQVYFLLFLYLFLVFKLSIKNLLACKCIR